MRQTSHKTWEDHKEISLATWGVDWDNMWHGWLLSYKKSIPTPVVYDLFLL